MLSPAPVLSVIIVAYRSRDELPACLGSLPAELAGRAVEVCVVNNSPGDGVAAWRRQTRAMMTFATCLLLRRRDLMRPLRPA